MSSKPDAWMAFYPGDYLRDTMHLTTEQHGAYLLLIMACFTRGGSLPADDDVLASIAKLSPERWSRLAPTIRPFFRRSGKSLRHGRIDAELERANRVSEARKYAGSKGGRPRKIIENSELALKQNETNSFTIAQANGKQNETQPQPHSQIEGGVVIAREADWPSGDVAGQLILTVASQWLDPQKSHGLITTAGRLEAWRRDGASWLRVVVPVVSSLCEDRQSAISSWKFFDNAIARGIASERDGLTISQGKTNGHGTAAQRAYDERQANYARAFASPGARPD